MSEMKSAWEKAQEKVRKQISTLMPKSPDTRAPD
jgi:hypothetical protein